MGRGCLSGSMQRAETSRCVAMTRQHNQCRVARNSHVHCIIS